MSLEDQPQKTQSCRNSELLSYAERLPYADPLSYPKRETGALILRDPPPDYIRPAEHKGDTKWRVCCPKMAYGHKEKLAQWLSDCPVEFPSHVDMTQGMPAFFNSVIGQDYKETCQNTSNILEMLRNLALPSYSEKADFSLTEEGTLGFVTVLECMTAALRFERNYRNNDYESS